MMGNGQELRCRHSSLVFRTHLKISLGHAIKTKEHGCRKQIGVQILSYKPILSEPQLFFGGGGVY